MEVLRLPPSSPNLIVYAERFVLSMSRAATGGTSSSGISGTRVRVPHVSGCPIFSRSCQGHASWSGARAHRWRSLMSLTGRGTRQPVALAKPP